MIKTKLRKNATEIDKFIVSFLKKQKKSLLVSPMKYGVISGGKKIRSTIILDAGKLFKVKEIIIFNKFNVSQCTFNQSLRTGFFKLF